jgi:hypothetical protein
MFFVATSTRYSFNAKWTNAKKTDGQVKRPIWTADNFAIFVPNPNYLLDYKENSYTQESWLPGDRDN